MLGESRPALRRPPASPARGLRHGPATPQGTPDHVLPRKRGGVKVAQAPEADMGVRYTRPDLPAPVRGAGRGRRGNRRGRGGSAVELEFTGEQEELRSSVRSFLEKECPIESVRAVVETGEAPEKLWGSMVALDWPALAIPEEYGGIGLTILETAVVVEELGRAVAPGPLLATVTQFAPMVREVGTPEQQQRFLSAGRHRRHRRDGGAGRPPAGLVVGRRHHDRRAGRRRVGPHRHGSSPSWPPRARPRSSSSPGPATAWVRSSCLPPRPA